MQSTANRSPHYKVDAVSEHGRYHCIQYTLYTIYIKCQENCYAHPGMERNPYSHHNIEGSPPIKKAPQHKWQMFLNHFSVYA